MWRPGQAASSMYEGELGGGERRRREEEEKREGRRRRRRSDWVRYAMDEVGYGVPLPCPAPQVPVSFLTISSFTTHQHLANQSEDYLG